MMRQLSATMITLMILGLCASGCNFLGTEETAPNRAAGDEPAVLMSNPEDGAVQVERRPDISVAFNVPMDRESVEYAAGFMSAFFIVPFEVTWEDSLNCVITPTELLGYNTDYTVFIGGGAMSAAGDPLAEQWSITFRTVTREPVVMETWPADGAVEVPINANPWIRFNQAMDAASVDSAITITPEAAFTCVWDDPDRVTLTLDDGLAPLTQYTIEISAAAANHNLEYTLVEPCVFAFTTAAGEDDVLPHIVAWDPPTGSLGVATDIGAVSVTFSESVNPATLTPQLFDMRMLVCVETFEPVWNADYTELTVAFDNLPAGVELFIDIGPFEDQFGNVSDDPERWWIVTAGDEDWFPCGPADEWFGTRTGEGDRCHPWEYGFVNRIEETDGNEFSFTEYATECGDEEPVRGLRLNKLAGRVELIGLGYYTWDEGSSSYVWDAFMMNPRPDWLQMPLQTGSSWGGSCEVELNMAPGLGTMTYSASLIGHEDLELTYCVDDSLCVPRCEEPSGPTYDAVLPDCAVVELNHEITVEIPVGDLFETVTVHTGVDTLWYCPGVGLVRMHSEAANTDAGGCTRTSWSREQVLWWNVNR